VLRIERQRARLTQGELAAAVGVSVATVKAWEQGRRSPYPAALARLAMVLVVSESRLTGGPWPPPNANLRELREARGWSIRNAAERLGETVGTLKACEQGLGLPGDPKAWCAAYQLTLPDLAAIVRRTVPDED
jgi:transcriptional regulator with XRE-family HTH domain